MSHALLQRVVQMAEDVMLRPRFGDGHSVAIAELRSEVQREVDKACEDVRTVDHEALALLDALGRIEFHRRFGVDDKVERWSIVAGAFLPMIRRDAFNAFKNERGR